MRICRIAGAAIVALGLGLGTASAAPYLQPGMQTMIQQGGTEGTLLGDLFGPQVVYVPVYVPVASGPRRIVRTRGAVGTPRAYRHRGFRQVTAR